MDDLISIKSEENFHQVNLGKITIYFSYESPIGVKVVEDDEEFVVVNGKYMAWSSTTSKHINKFFDENNETHLWVSEEEFNNSLRMVLEDLL